MAADGVPSNIVGYNTVTLDKAWTIVGFNFEECGTGPRSLQELFPYTEGMTKSNVADFADCIQVQNAGGTYDIYFMSNGKNAKGTADVSGINEKWVVSGGTTLANPSFEPGTAFWYLARKPDPSFQLALAGQALTSVSSNVTINLSMKHIANPYATDLSLQELIPYTVGMTKSNVSDFADCIQIQNAGGTYDIYFMSNGKNAKGTGDVAGIDEKWVVSGGTTLASDSVVIPGGRGAWYLRRGGASFEITVARPFSLD